MNAIVGNVAYVPTCPAGLAAFDKASGKELWRAPIKSFSRPAYADGKLCISNGWKLAGLDAASGRTLREFTARGEVIGVPAIVGDTPLFGDCRGNRTQ